MSVVLLSAIALIGLSEGGHKLEHKFKVGDVMKYSIVRTSDSESMMPSTGGTWHVELTVESVKDGDIVLDAKKTVEKLDIEDQPIISGDILKRMKAPTQATITLKKDGTVEVKSDSPTTMFSDFGQWYRDFLLAKLPDKEINVGDTWSEGLKLPSSLSKAGKDEIVTYKLEGTEKVNGTDCYRVSATSSFDQEVTGRAPINQGDIGSAVSFSLKRKCSYTLFVACDTGRLMQKTGTEELQIRGENLPEIPPMTISLTVKLAKD